MRARVARGNQCMCVFKLNKYLFHCHGNSKSRLRINPNSRWCTLFPVLQRECPFETTCGVAPFIYADLRCLDLLGKSFEFYGLIEFQVLLLVDLGDFVGSVVAKKVPGEGDETP